MSWWVGLGVWLLCMGPWLALAAPATPALSGTNAGASSAVKPTAAAPKPPPLAPNRNKVTILYHTDLMGRWRSFSCDKAKQAPTGDESSRDVANLLALIQKVRRESKAQRELAPLLVSTGNTFAPDRAARFVLHRGAQEGIRFLANQLKLFQYDLLGLGADAFWLKPDDLGRLLRLSKKHGVRFSFANLSTSDLVGPLGSLRSQSNQVAPSTFVFQRGPWRIGMFHVAPGKKPPQVSSLRKSRISPKDPIEVATQRVALLRNKHKVDVVVVLSQLDNPTSQGKEARKLASSVSGIDVIVTNGMGRTEGTHALIYYNQKRRPTYIVGGQAFGTQLGKVELTLRRKANGSPVVGFGHQLLDTEDNLFHQPLRTKLLRWGKLYCKLWSTPLGRGRIDSTDGMSEEQFRKYVLHLMRLKGRAEVAFFPKGTVVSQGFPIQTHISRDDMFQVIPQEVILVRITLLGSALSTLIGTSSDAGPTSAPFSFVGVSSDPQVNGRAIEASMVYSLVTTQAVANGLFEQLQRSTIRSREVLLQANRTPLRLRELLIRHFTNNAFLSLRGASPQNIKSKVYKIPYKGNLRSLKEKPNWTFQSSFQMGLSALAIEPININVVYTQHEELNGGFYEKINIQGQGSLSLNMETSQHLWKTSLQLNYAVDTSIQWAKGPPPGPIDPRIYQESTDVLTFQTQYHWRSFKSFFAEGSKWEVASPFVEAVVETEVTTSQRPDLGAEAFFAATGSTEVFHHFETKAKLGLSFQYASILSMKLGAIWRKEWALGLLLKDPANTPVRVNLDSTLGFTVEYEVEGWNFATLGATTLTLKSSAAYSLTFVTGTEKAGLSIHDLRWKNEVRVGITQHLFVALGFRMLLFRGIFRDLSTQEKKFIHGPLAFRIDPQLSLGFNWGTRMQQGQ
ncbi:MAG: hypothetical protein EP343_12435 [Deltaproteobacteria bacterium]|nr:MAG: hypothetical protein EP343_12435 [Deltaproteobacteria bacterium]